MSKQVPRDSKVKSKLLTGDKLTNKIEGNPDCGNNPGKNKHVYTLYTSVIDNLFYLYINYCHLHKI